MKTILNKMIFFLAITFVILLSGYFIYQSYFAYKGYVIAQNGDQYIAIIKNKNRALKKIELECSLSALYLGKEGKIDFSQIQTARDETDNALKSIKQFILNNPKFLNDLQYARSRVDVVSSNYKDILITYYQDEISNTLLKEIQNNIQVLSLGLSGLENELSTYSTFINYRNKISKEKSFIGYILTLSKKMNKEDLLLWEALLADNQVDMQFQNLSELNFKTRVGIVRGITTGNYQINIKKWFETNDQKINAVVQSEETIYKQILSQISNETSYPKVLIYNVLIALFLILLFLLLIRLQKNNAIQNKPSRMNGKLKNSHTTYENADLPVKNLTQDDDMSLNKKEEIHSSPVLDSLSYNPLEKFQSFTQEFIEEASEKKIDLDYYIDLTIPTYSIGDFYKIEQALDYLIHYVISSTGSRSIIKFQIDNIAQNALESAIRISIREHKRHFTKEEKRIIHNSEYNTLQNKSTHTKISGIKANLVQVNKIISSINGNFKIEENPAKGTDFFIIVNLKKQ